MIKVFKVEHDDCDTWLFEGLIQMLTGMRFYTPFSCAVTRRPYQEEDAAARSETEMRILHGRHLYTIVPTLAGGAYASYTRKKGMKLDLCKLNLPENVWMGVVGSVATPL